MEAYHKQRLQDLEKFSEEFHIEIQGNGMLEHYNEDIQLCIKKHTKRWKQVTRYLQSSIHGFCNDFPKYGMSWEQLLILIWLSKGTHFTRELDAEVKKNIASFGITCYNYALKWNLCIKKLLLNHKHGRQPRCTEMGAIYNKLLTTVIHIIKKNECSFNSRILSTLYEHKQPEPIDLNYQYGAMSYNDFFEDTSILPLANIFNQFHHENYHDCVRHLLEIQLTLRCLMIMKISTMDKRENESKRLFKGVAYNGVEGTCAVHELHTYFDHAKSLFVKFQSCKLVIAEISISNCGTYLCCLDVSILLFIFSSIQTRILNDLRQLE
jgi:hypothetical protein